MKHYNFNLFRKPAIAMAMFAALLFGSCKDDDNEMAAPIQTVAEIVIGDNNYSLLETALVHAGLATVLNGDGPFTVFAPDNKAFIAAGFDTEDKIKAVPAATLKNILLYHVLNQRVPSSGIAAASNTPIESAAGLTVFITKNSSGVFVNGATVTAADIMARNGVIHGINTVLMPPMTNIVEAAQANPNLSFLVAAVLRASQGSTNVAQVLSGAGPFTAFAPTNQAFINAGFPDIAAIQSADPAVLTSILTYHVIAGRVFSSDLEEGSKPKTVNGATVSITLAGGAKVKGDKNNTASTIAAANILTTNGVIHVIDQVLLP